MLSGTNLKARAQRSGCVQAVECNQFSRLDTGHDLDASVVGDPGLHSLAFEMAISDDVNIAAILVLMQSLARYSHNFLLVRDAYVHGHIDVGQQPAVFVVYSAEHLADIAGSVCGDRIGQLADFAAPDLSRKSVPCDGDRLRDRKFSQFRLVDKRSHLHPAEIRKLNQQFSLLNVFSLLDWNRVHGAIKWRADFAV